MNQQMNRADTGETFVRAVPLRVDPTRSVDGRETGILVRAMKDGQPGTYDIVTLHRDSLFRWLRSRGGANPWAENVVAVLLGHKL